VRDVSRIVFGQSRFEIAGQTGIALVGMGEALKEIDIIHAVDSIM
jgi:hypothetical protein